jgi:arabinose-5-phosphate isomerase
MMTEGDVVLVLSNSGETPELADLVTYTRRFGIPMIGIASRAQSTLMQQSDVQILLPQCGEACGSGVVPTTSTTMTLALGDALAVALMEHRKFTAEKFRQFHPGGKLGAQLASVSDLMHVGETVPSVSTDTPMTDTLLAISQKGFGVVAVLDENQTLVGIVTDGDLRRHMDGLLDRTAGEVMTKSPATVSIHALAAEALAIMNARKITCLFTAHPETPRKLAGILHIHDCLRAGVV